MNRTLSRPALFCGVAALLFPVTISAEHWWGGYHWPTDGNGLVLDVGSNVGSVWEPYLDEAIGDWNQSPKLLLTKATGGTNPKNCKPIAGRIEVCSSTYGFNGWLGVAQIWVSGTHIQQAVTKVNDSYYNHPTYNKPAWRRLVMCQEIAHDFGLGHQDEIFNNPNVGSCMDYTNDPDGTIQNQASNEHPNQHDYQQVQAIYGHADPVGGGGGSVGGGRGRGGAGATAPEHPSQWGRLIRQNGDRRLQVFELDLGNGRRMLTRVFWADPERDRGGH